MNETELKEQMLVFVTSLKLVQKEILSLEEEAAKWKGRLELARERGMDDLSNEAGKEAARINGKLTGCREEEQELKQNIDALRRQLPVLAARERSVDPDLLEQEILMVLGRTEEQVEADKAFRELERESAAGPALQALKEKMGQTGETS